MSDSESEVEGQGPTPAKTKKHSYTVNLKLEAVAYAKTHSKKAASQKFKVDRRLWRARSRTRLRETCARLQ